MYTIPALLRQQLNQVVAPKSQALETPQVKAPGDGFDALIRGILSPNQTNEVSEEALFAGLVVERIASLKGEEAGNSFAAVLEKQRQLKTGKNGYIFEENAARDALKEFAASGAISTDEAEQIHSQAFSAAQLDNNTGSLFDHIGGTGDPTKAVEAIDAALAKAKQVLEKYASGEISVPSHGIHDDYSVASTLRSTNAVSSAEINKSNLSGKSNKLDGADGLLWKPVSETLGKAIMMLAPEYAGQVKSIQLVNSEGTVIDRARYFSGGSEMYPREKWVFKRPGEDYPNGVSVRIKFNDGESQLIKIPKPGQRYD